VEEREGSGGLEEVGGREAGLDHCTRSIQNGSTRGDSRPKRSNKGCNNGCNIGTMVALNTAGNPLAVAASQANLNIGWHTITLLEGGV
jgi:hypothetical protein